MLKRVFDTKEISMRTPSALARGKYTDFRVARKSWIFGHPKTTVFVWLKNTPRTLVRGVFDIEKKIFFSVSFIFMMVAIGSRLDFVKPK
jgi:hypothetical protein